MDFETNFGLFVEKTFFNLLQFEFLENILCLYFCSKYATLLPFLLKLEGFCYNPHSFVTTTFDKNLDFHQYSIIFL